MPHEAAVLTGLGQSGTPLQAYLDLGGGVPTAP